MTKKKSSYENVHRLQHKDGYYIWVLARGIALWDKRDNPTRFVGTNVDLTAQKQAEAALREQEEFLRLIIDNIPQLIFWKDLHSVYLGCNKKVSQINQLNCVEEIIGKTDFDLVWKDHAEKYRIDDHYVMETDSPKLHVIETMLQGDGQQHWVEINKIPLHDASGKVVGILGTLEDITERKQAEELLRAYNQTLEQEVMVRTQALREQEAFLRLVIDNIPQYIYWKNLDGIFLGCNQRFAEVAGVTSPESLLGKTDFDCPWRERAAEFQQLDREVMEADTPQYHFIEPYAWENNTLGWKDTNKIPLHDTNNQVVGILVSSEDITARKRTEDALKQAHERFKTVLDSLNAAVYVCDMQTYEILFANQYTLEQLDSRIIGKICWQTLQGEQTKPCNFCTNEQLISPEGYPLGIYTWEKYNTVFKRWFYMQDRAIQWDDGRWVRLTIATDITTQKQVEAALRQSEARLAETQKIAHLGHWEWDLNSGMVQCSEEVVKQFGFANTPIQVSFKRFRNAIHPEDQIYLQQQVNQALIGQEHCETEFRVIQSEGTIRYLQAFAKVIRDANHYPTHLLGSLQDITERKQAEIAIQESEARFKAIFNNAAAGIATMDLTGHFIQVNQKWLTMLGYTIEELLQLSHFDITHPQDIEENRQKRQQLLAGEIDSYQIEKRYICKDKRVIWTHLWVSPHHNPDGQIIMLIGIIFDITERKQAEDALRESEARYRGVVEDQTELVCRFLPDTTLTFVNDAYCRYFGIQREEILGQSFLALIPQEHRSLVLADIQVLIDNPQIASQIVHEYPVMRSGGAIAWQQWTNRAITSETEELLEFQSVGRDITERKQAEQALAESEKRFRHMADSAPVFIWVADIDKRCHYFNRGWLEFTGRTLAQEQDHGWMAGIHPDDYHLCLETYLNAFDTRQSFTMEFRLRRHDGQYRWVLNAGVPRLTETGNFIGYIGSGIDITERKQILEALRESETRLKAIFDNVSVGIVLTDRDGRFIQCNSRWLEMIGYTSTEITQLTYADITYSEDLILCHTYYKPLTINTINNYHIEKRFLTKNGHFFWADVSVTGIQDHRNHFELAIGVIVDITERKQAEEALRKSEERFNLAMRGANDGLWDWNLETKQTYFSPRWKQMIGYEEEEISDSFDEFTTRIHPDDLAPTMATTMAYLNKQISSYEVHFRMQHKDQHYLWILARGIAMWNEQGKSYRMVGTHMDLTAQKQAEQALRASEHYRRTLIEEALIGLLLLDTQGNIMEANTAYANLTGYSLEELQRLSFWDITPEKYFQFEQEQFHILTTTGRFGPIEQEYIHKQGHLVPVRLSGVMVEREQGSFIWCNVEDITEQKQTETKLQQAKEAAEVANHAKSTFLANMSHELRTPLNAILGYAQILRIDKSLTTKQRENANIIHRSGDYLLTLINDILDLSKIEAGRFELCPAEFHLGEFLDSVTDLFQMRAKQKGIFFHYEKLSELPEGVYTDDKRLRQILINLLSNAIKFTEQGSVTLKVSATPSTKTVHYDWKLWFQVEDSGVGIALEELEKIFLPFQQVGDKTYRQQGTGLGLSITKKLIEKMGGKLHVESMVGQGSLFWFSLDLLEVSGFSPSEEVKPATILGFQGKTRKIMIVDDNWENRELLYNILFHIGFEIIEAADGQEALNKAQEVYPDLIVLDLMMPTMDGFEFARRIRQHAELKQIVIIAASASVFEHHRLQSLQAGCNDFIPKPIHAEALLARLQQHLGLEWIYEELEPTDNSIVEVDEIPLSNNEIKLSPEQASVLLKLARMGDIKGILEQADKIEQMDNTLSPLMKKIRYLANEFEDDQIREIVKPYLHETVTH